MHGSGLGFLFVIWSIMNAITMIAAWADGNAFVFTVTAFVQIILTMIAVRVMK